jgi:hypothetical protein
VLDRVPVLDLPRAVVRRGAMREALWISSPPADLLAVLERGQEMWAAARLLNSSGWEVECELPESECFQQADNYLEWAYAG